VQKVGTANFSRASRFKAVLSGEKKKYDFNSRNVSAITTKLDKLG
jgi:hypothetical protein